MGKRFFRVSFAHSTDKRISPLLLSVEWENVFFVSLSPIRQIRRCRFFSYLSNGTRSLRVFFAHSTKRIYLLLLSVEWEKGFFVSSSPIRQIREFTFFSYLSNGKRLFSCLLPRPPVAAAVTPSLELDVGNFWFLSNWRVRNTWRCSDWGMMCKFVAVPYSGPGFDVAQRK